MCGVVDGGIVDGLYGYEAGQSGVGDIFAWYVANQVPARYSEAARGGRAESSTSTSPTSARPSRSARTG